MDPDDPAANIKSRLQQLNFANWIKIFETTHRQLRVDSDALLKAVVDSIREACPQLRTSMRPIVSASIRTVFTDSCNQVFGDDILSLTERQATAKDLRCRWRSLDRLRSKFITAVLGLLFPEHPTTVDDTSSAADNDGLDSTAAESVTTDAGFDSTVNDMCEPIPTERDSLSDPVDPLVDNSNTSQQISSANSSGLDLLASASAIASASAVLAEDNDFTIDHSSSGASSRADTFRVICKAYDVVLNEQRSQKSKEGMTANEIAGPLSVSNSYLVAADTQCGVKFGVTISTRSTIRKRYELFHFTIAAIFLHLKLFRRYTTSMFDIRVFVYPLPCRTNTDEEINIAIRDDEFIAKYGKFEPELLALDTFVAQDNQELQRLSATRGDFNSRKRRPLEKPLQASDMDRLTHEIDVLKGRLHVYDQIKKKAKAVVQYSYHFPNRCLVEEIFGEMVRLTYLIFLWCL